MSEKADRQAIAILVLDDSAQDRRALIRQFASAGIRAEPAQAADLDSFDAALDTRPFDLVFIDYNLAGETGLEALALLASHPLQVRAAPVMITGQGQLDIAVAAMRAGCVDYLHKDQITAETLRRTLAAAIDRRLLDPAKGPEQAAAIARLDAASFDQLRDSVGQLLARSRGLSARAADSARLLRDVADIETTCERISDMLGPPAPR